MLRLGPGNPACQKNTTTDPVNGIFCPNEKRLCPNYVANARELVRQLQPYILNDTIVGLFLGDEQASSIPFDQFNNVSILLKQLLDEAAPPPRLAGPARERGIFLYANEDEAFGGFGGAWPFVPRGLDFVSVDSCECFLLPICNKIVLFHHLVCVV
jgi:hypothetical protein